MRLWPAVKWLCVLAALAAGLWLTYHAASPRPHAQGQPVASAATSTTRPKVLLIGRLNDPALQEASGIVASRKCPGYYWLIADSDGPARVFACDATGRATGSIAVNGAKNIDWEDIAIDERARLYIGDTGDNNRQRPHVTIHRLVEADPTKGTRATVEATWHFRYPTGPADCEAMFVWKGSAYVIAKEVTASRLFRIRLDGPTGKPQQAQYLGNLKGSSWITGADLSADGRRLALISYTATYIFDFPQPFEKMVEQAERRSPSASRPVAFSDVHPSVQPCQLKQAEGICWVVDPKSAYELLICNEQRDLYGLPRK